MARIPVATGLAGVKALFDGRYQPLVGKDGGLTVPLVSDLAVLIPSGTTQEILATLSAAPGLSERQKDLVISGLLSGKLELVAKVFDAALGIPKDDFDDDRIGLHNNRVRDLASKGNDHPLYLTAATLEKNPKAFDGAVLFGTTREMGESGAIINALTPDMEEAAPTILEFEAAVKDAISAIWGFKDETGDPIGNGAEFGLLVPRALHWQAKACAEDATLWSGSAAKVNEVRGQFVAQVLPYLTSGVVMYTYIRNRGTKPLVLQERESLSSESLGEGSDEWVKNDRAIFKVRARRAMGPGHPAYIVRSTFTES